MQSKQSKRRLPWLALCFNGQAEFCLFFNEPTRPPDPTGLNPGPLFYNHEGSLPENRIASERVTNDSAAHSMKTNITLAVVLLCAATASAQTFEISASGGYNYIWRNTLGSLNAEDPKKEDSRLKPGAAFGARLTYNTKGYYGHEITILQTNAKFRSNVEQASGEIVEETGKARVTLASYNFLIYMMPNREKWRPYITGGIHGVQFGAPRIPSWPGGGARSYGGNFGGGIKLFPHKNFFFRVDIRDYITGKPYDLTYPDPLPGEGIQSGGIMHMIEGTVGVGITF